jgi:hypothetical protein
LFFVALTEMMGVLGCAACRRPVYEKVEYRFVLFGSIIGSLFCSMDAFYDAIGRYLEAGIQDLCFICAPGYDDWQEPTITSIEMLHKIALGAIPAIRKAA